MPKYRYKRIRLKDLRLNFKMLTLIGILLLSLAVGGSSLNPKDVPTTRLVKDLLQDYDPRLLPVRKFGENVSIAVNIALRQLMRLDEKNQIISLNIWMRLTFIETRYRPQKIKYVELTSRSRVAIFTCKQSAPHEFTGLVMVFKRLSEWWKDPRLRWNASDYGGVNQIILPFQNVWTPDITVFDSASETMMPGRRTYRPIVLHDGTVIYLYPTIISSICPINVLYFPMDTQECRIMFGSWSHSGIEIDFQPKIPTGDMDFYVRNNEWTVMSFPARRNVAYYKCCPEPFPDVTFYLKIRRKPLFYILSVLFPCMLTSSVAILAFLLPPESGEKVSLNVTILLSLAVFLLMVSDQLPASSDHFPYVGMYFACSMFLVSLSLVMTVFVLNMHFRTPEERKVPPWMKKVFLRFGRRFLLRQSENKIQPSRVRKTSNVRLQNIRKYSDDQSRNKTAVFNLSTMDLQEATQGSYISLNVTNEINEITQSQQFNIRDESGPLGTSGNEWQEIAMVMDRMFLISFIIITLVTTMVFLGMMDNEEES